MLAKVTVQDQWIWKNTGGIMSSFSDHKRLNKKKFRFIPNIVADPANKEKVSRNVRLRPETFKRVHKLACQEQCSFSEALERMLNTEDAKALAPCVVNTLIKRVQDTQIKYASYNIFTEPTRKTKTNGTTKGISGKV